jgi:hypothetical protein
MLLGTQAECVAEVPPQPLGQGARGRVNLGSAAEVRAQQAGLVFQQHAGLVGGTLQALGPDLPICVASSPPVLPERCVGAYCISILGNALDRGRRPPAWTQIRAPRRSRNAAPQ